MRLFVSIALTGERGRQRSLLKAKVKEMEDEKDSREAGSLDITSGYSVVDAKECSAALAKDEVNWALEAEIAATVTELALDAASTVLEGKMRHNGKSARAKATKHCRLMTTFFLIRASFSRLCMNYDETWCVMLLVLCSTTHL